MDLENKIINIYSIEEVSVGAIKKNDKNNINYDCPTIKGWSGSPIPNKQNNKIIGIHKEYNKAENLNKGVLIKSILKDIKDKKIQFEEEKECNNNFQNLIKSKNIFILTLIIGFALYFVFKSFDDLKKEIEKKNNTINDQNKEIDNQGHKINEQNTEIEKLKKEIEEMEKYAYKNEEYYDHKWYQEDSEEIFTTWDLNLDESSSYRICLYGSKARVGGYGGIQCAEFYFEKDSKIHFEYEGEEAGGKGGKNCGRFGGGIGFNGGGLSMATFNDNILIIAGGGGGDSEKKKNKGGNFQEDGKGKFGGKKATINSKGKAGNSNDNSENGKKLKGGNGGSTGRYCGGGGGNGYFGRGGGGSGGSGEQGGGGGGSNFCNKTMAKKCFYYNQYDINYYWGGSGKSGYIVYKQKK